MEDVLGFCLRTCIQKPTLVKADSERRQACFLISWMRFLAARERVVNAFVTLSGPKILTRAASLSYELFRTVEAKGSSSWGVSFEPVSIATGSSLSSRPGLNPGSLPKYAKMHK